MNTASPSATMSSSTTTHTMRSLLSWVAAILLAACAQVPPKPEGPPAAPAVLACPAAIPAPPCPSCPQCPPPKPAPESARYLDAPFEALPGWGTGSLAQSLRAFAAGCPRPGALARACDAARSVPPGDEGAARQFFESTFQPYALVSSDGAESG